MEIIKKIISTLFGMFLLAFIVGYLVGSYFGVVKTLDRSTEFDLWRFPAFLIESVITEDKNKYLMSWYYKEKKEENEETEVSSVFKKNRD